MVAKKKLIVANWKMAPSSAAEASKIFSGIKRKASTLRNVQTVVCPPFLYLEALQKKVTGHRCVLGAQDVFWAKGTGAYTGEISAGQLTASGAHYVILGHSERRALGESDDEVNKKVIAALRGGLIVILCVGESERDKVGNYLKFVARELVLDLKKVPRKYFLNLVVAYEPIWAISTHRTGPALPDDAYEMSIFIRRVLTDIAGKDLALSIPVIYGGSVDARDAPGFLESGGVSGLLVGHESLNSSHFNEILQIAEQSARV